MSAKRRHDGIKRHGTVASIQRNGITLENLAQAEESAYLRGHRDGEEFALRIACRRAAGGP